ncbi:MAG: HD domain-containing protein [Candidatus Saccharibacteria bacterium]|nr:HD domain-containing protein [Candidatus Saccharibacteria bacterium]
MDRTEMFIEYRRIMENELRLSGRKALGVAIPESKEVYDAAWRIMEVAKSSFLQRSYIARYGIGTETEANESVGSHTNLVLALVDMALAYEYGPDFGFARSGWPTTMDGYSYREIMEVVRIHDLPENVMGDIPDDGARDDAAKAAVEEEYVKEYTRRYTFRERDFKKQVQMLFQNMENRSTPTGRLLFAADKTAALIITLTYDMVGKSPLMAINDKDATERDKAEMAICDFKTEDGKCKASEMWAIDHFQIRNNADFDDSGFFRALAVMYTLMVNGRWYDWREKDYLSEPPV